METRIDELDDGIFRLATSVPGSTRTLNQFLIDADEPLLFHAGLRATFDDVFAAVGRIMPAERLRWLAFSHAEADEIGAMNGWLARIAGLRVLCAPQLAATSINDLADRPPVVLGTGDVRELGGRRVRLVPTPDVPHHPDAVMLYEEVTGLLGSSDLGSNDIVDRAVVDELALAVEPPGAMFPGLTALTPATPSVLGQLAVLAPRTMAVMHGASLRGDVAGALRHFAATEMRHLADAVPAPARHGGDERDRKERP